jgi:hypothetical protein
MVDSVKPSSQNMFATYSQSILARYYYRKAKASMKCKKVMWKRKEIWEEANSWHAIYHVVSVGTKLPLVHIVGELYTRLFLLNHQVSYKSTTWFAIKAHHKGTRQAPLITLMSPSLRGFSTQGGASPRPSHKASSPLHTKLEDWRLCRRATKALRLLAHLVQLDPLENHLTR